MTFLSKNCILTLWVKAKREGKQQECVKYSFWDSKVLQSESQWTNDNAYLEQRLKLSFVLSIYTLR